MNAEWSLISVMEVSISTVVDDWVEVIHFKTDLITDGEVAAAGHVT